MRPIIGITGNYSADNGLTTITKAYYHCVERAGGAPVVFPPTTDETILKAQLEAVDGLLFTGGADLNPLLWGEEPSPKLGGINAERDRSELLLPSLPTTAMYQCSASVAVCKPLLLLSAERYNKTSATRRP